MAEAAPSDCGQDNVTLLSACFVNEHLDSASRHRRGDVTVVEMRVVNDTPLMLGGWGTLHYLPVGDGPEVVPTLLTAKPIVGKVRWLLKRVIIYMGLARDLREAENTPRVKVVPEDPGAGKAIEMGLVQLLFGSIKTGGGKGRGAWKGLYTIQVIHNPPEGRIEEIAFKEMVEERCSGSNRYFLITMGNKKSIIKELLLPLKPGAASAQILIHRRQDVRIYNIEDSNEREIDPSLLDSLVVTAIVIVLRLLGIGKGATRGFGRFKITQLNTNINPSSLTPFSDSHVRSLLEIVDAPDSAKALQDAIYQLLALVYQSLARTTPRLLAANNVPGIYVKAYDLNNVNRETFTVLELINKIANSVLRNSLTSRCGIGGRDCILRELTWVLGLPRKISQKNKLYTGYFFVKSSLIQRNRNRRINAGEFGNYIVSKGFERMLSPFVIFPVVGNSSPFIVVLVFRFIENDASMFARPLESDTRPVLINVKTRTREVRINFIVNSNTISHALSNYQATNEEECEVMECCERLSALGSGASSSPRTCSEVLRLVSMVSCVMLHGGVLRVLAEHEGR